MGSHEAMGGLVNEMAADSSVIVVPRWTSWSLQSTDVALPSGDVPSLRISRRAGPEKEGRSAASAGIQWWPSHREIDGVATGRQRAA